MKRTQKKPKLFLDSGAFTAFTKGVKIDIDEYIQFIKDHNDMIEIAVNLDVIGDKRFGPTEATAYLGWKNQKRMEEAGLTPMPVYHRGEEPIEYLKYYIENYDYIGLGMGRAIGNKNQIPQWLDRIFEKYICDEDGNPKTKVHGFGVTAPDIVGRYPWYSVDSSSPIQGAVFGKIFLPPITDFRNGELDFMNMRLFNISDQAKHKPGAADSYLNFSPERKKIYEELFNEHGFDIGQIAYVKRRKTRKDKKKETQTTQKRLPMGLPMIEGEKNGDTLANSWAQRLLWNQTVWKIMADKMGRFKISGTGEEFQTHIYTVCTSSGHLQVYDQLDPPPRILVSYEYLRSGESFLKHVINYQNNEL